MFDTRYELRLTKEEKAVLERNAHLHGMSASEYVRKLIKTNDSLLADAS